MIKEAKITYNSKAEKEDVLFWKNTSSEEKIAAVQYLREQYIHLFNKEEEYAQSRERLRRVYRVIK